MKIETKGGNALYKSQSGTIYFGDPSGQPLRLGGQHDWDYLVQRGAAQLEQDVPEPVLAQVPSAEIAEVHIPGHEAPRTVAWDGEKIHFLGYTPEEVRRGIELHGIKEFIHVDSKLMLSRVLAERKARR